MRSSWLPPQWNGRERIHHPVNWARLPELDVGIALIQTKADHGHENRWYLYCRKFNEADVQALPVLASTVITSSPGSTQTITSDSTWNNNTGGNVVEVIGAGARGARGASTSTSGGGGGGGAYTRMADQVITTPGTTPMYVRVGGTTATDGTAGGDSWWTLTSPGTSFPVSGTAVGAKGGAALASATSATGGTGGASTAAYPGTPTAKTNGGNGGTAGALATAGAGGGGAGGWSGNGIAATGGPSAGGAGNANTSGGGTGGATGSPGVAGNAGTNIQTGPNAGSGGGGGGGNAAPSTGGAGGLYGGGGGGGGRSTGVGGQGAQGVIVLTWTPVFTGTLTVTEAVDTAAFPSGTVAWNAVLAASEDTPIDLLLHLDGTNASTTFPDSGGYNRTVTAHGAAQIDTSQPVFGGQALKLAADADYLSVDTGAWDFGTGDFTVDFRARLSSASEGRMFFDGGASGFQILHDGSALKLISAAGSITGAGLSANTNYHLAATRASGSTRLFKDGVQQGSTLTDATNYGTTAGYPRIGGGTGISGILTATEASDVGAFTGTVASSMDSATTAWIAAVGSGNVDSNHQGWVNDLIVGLKADGLWTKLDRVWLLAAQNSTCALVDIKALASATAYNSPTFTADRGYAFNGSNNYLDTGTNPFGGGFNYTQNSAHVGLWITSATTPVWALIGHFDSQGLELGYYSGQWQVASGPNDASAFGTGASTVAGLGVLTRTAASGAGARSFYKNGSSTYSDSVASTGIANGLFFVGGISYLGGLIHPSTGQVAIVTIGGGLNATDNTNLYNRLNTYRAAVGVT